MNRNLVIGIGLLAAGIWWMRRKPAMAMANAAVMTRLPSALPEASVLTPPAAATAAEKAFAQAPSFAERALTAAGLDQGLIGTTGYQQKDFQALYVAEAQGQAQADAWQVANDFIAAGNPGAAGAVLAQAGINPALIPASLK